MNGGHIPTCPPILDTSLKTINGEFAGQIFAGRKTFGRAIRNDAEDELFTDVWGIRCRIHLHIIRKHKDHISQKRNRRRTHCVYLNPPSRRWRTTQSSSLNLGSSSPAWVRGRTIRTHNFLTFPVLMGRWWFATGPREEELPPPLPRYLRDRHSKIGIWPS